MSLLKKLAVKYKTDKHGVHFYTDIYEKYLGSKKNKKINLLEIGIGGFNNPAKGGESLRMWNEYFKYGLIYGLDIFKKNIFISDRVKIFQGSQTNYKDLLPIIKKAKKFDFVIDDGSHICNDQISTFKLLFPFLKRGGYYFIEDIQTSYFLKDGGDAFYLENKKTAVNFFKGIIDKINYMEFENPFFKPDYFCKNITEIHFYHNLIVVKKNNNNEKSNILKYNKKIVGGKSFVKTRKFIKNLKYLFYFLKSLIYKFLDLIKF